MAQRHDGVPGHDCRARGGALPVRVPRRSGGVFAAGQPVRRSGADAWPRAAVGVLARRPALGPTGDHRRSGVGDHGDAQRLRRGKTLRRPDLHDRHLSHLGLDGRPAGRTAPGRLPDGVDPVFVAAGKVASLWGQVSQNQPVGSAVPAVSAWPSEGRPGLPVLPRTADDRVHTAALALGLLGQPHWGQGARRDLPEAHTQQHRGRDGDRLGHSDDRAVPRLHRAILRQPSGRGNQPLGYPRLRRSGRGDRDGRPARRRAGDTSHRLDSHRLTHGAGAVLCHPLSRGRLAADRRRHGAELRAAQSGITNAGSHPGAIAVSCQRAAAAQRSHRRRPVRFCGHDERAAADADPPAGRI